MPFDAARERGTFARSVIDACIMQIGSSLLLWESQYDEREAAVERTGDRSPFYDSPNTDRRNGNRKQINKSVH